jgi:putative membrane protein
MAGARVLSCLGVRPALAGGLMVVDVTAEVLAQFVFSVLGVALWLARQPAGDVARSALWGLGLSVPVLLAFVLIQRSTIVRFLETLPSRLMPQTWRAPAEGAGIHAAIAALWTDHRRVGQAVLIHLAAWAVSTGEAWLALGLLHRPLPLADVLAMESIVFAVNSAAFFVPGALGVQEGSYLLLGAALGLPPEAALAVSLLKRGRALCLGLPALAAWHRLEQRSAKSA